jgi:hypothetical protein
MDEKNCLKCGRPCDPNQSFCGACLTEMKKYPVKPGVVVLLPQIDKTVKPPVRRRYSGPTPEEQIEKLKKRVLGLWLALIVTMAAAGVLGWLVISEYMEKDDGKLLPGQNYSAETLPENPETE